MKGGIYTEEKCPMCGQAMRDNGRSAVACPTHKEQKASMLFVRFGRSIKQRFRSYEEASRFLNGLRFKSDEGSFDKRDYQPDRPLSFTVLSDKYLDYRKHDLKPGSYKVLKPRIRRAQKYFKHTNVKQINYAGLEDFIHAQTDLASKSKHELLSAIHCFYQWMINRDEIHEKHMPLTLIKTDPYNLNEIDPPIQDGIERSFLTLG